MGCIGQEQSSFAEPCSAMTLTLREGTSRLITRYSVDRSPDLSVAGLARRHVRGFESKEISVDDMQIRVKTGAVFSADRSIPEVLGIFMPAQRHPHGSTEIYAIYIQLYLLS